MKKINFYISILFLSIICPEFLKSTQLLEDYQAAIDSCRNYVTALKDSLFVPGMQITIMRDNTVLWSKGLGFSNLLTQAKVQPYTRFRIASVSKLFTSSAVMKLVESGAISLDSTVRKYFPDFPKKRFPIPIFSLLNHTSGIRHYSGNEFSNPQHFRTLNEGLDIFKFDSLLFEPGTKALYSSYGYNLLGAIIEKVSKIRYQDYVYMKLIAPIKLKQTIPDRLDIPIKNRTEFYMMDSQHIIRECPPCDLTYRIPTGGYLSTSSDLAKYCSELLSGHILSDSILNIYLSPTYLKDKVPSNWCLGLRMTQLDKKHNVYWQLGTTYGASSAIAFEPKTKTVITWITNMNIKWSEVQILQLMRFMLKIKSRE